MLPHSTAGFCAFYQNKDMIVNFAPFSHDDLNSVMQCLLKT